MSHNIKRLDEGFLKSVPPKIDINFTDGGIVKIWGESSMTKKHKEFKIRKSYLVQYYVMKNGQAHWLHSFVMPSTPEGDCYELTSFVKFYVPWLIKVKEYVPDYGFTTIYTHQLNLKGKPVLILLDTNDEEEGEIWAQVALEFQKKHDCDLTICSSLSSVREKYKDGSVPYVITSNINVNTGQNYYASYEIGRYDFEEWGAVLAGRAWHYDVYEEENFPDNTAFRLAPTNLFASYKNQRNYHNQTSEEIARDILGLSDWRII